MWQQDDVASRLVSRDFRRSRSSEHVGKFDGFLMHAKKYLIEVCSNSIFMASNNNETEIFSIRRSIFITGCKNISISIN